jgi:hypothetical protein
VTPASVRRQARNRLTPVVIVWPFSSYRKTTRRDSKSWVVSREKDGKTARRAIGYQRSALRNGQTANRVESR